MNLIHLNADRYFSFRQEEKTGKYYLSIPISNSQIDYMEYYEVPKSMVDSYPNNIQEVEDLVKRCREGLMFHISLNERAPDRGGPWYPKNENS
ncbi:hypothetical protein [Cellvibrio mixtus]|uniref:hypothetical protein n=1 Tax=Cellvibrio mixtus TaxID=39650 RepID=UPI0005873D4C|nr:hypothetical protein [Cellvibrio mixtus]